MYKLRTTKLLKYFDEVIRLHYEEGYGEDRIASLLPVGHSTVSRWIAIFASQNDEVPRCKETDESMEKKLEEGYMSPEEELRTHDGISSPCQPNKGITNESKLFPILCLTESTFNRV